MTDISRPFRLAPPRHPSLRRSEDTDRRKAFTNLQDDHATSMPSFSSGSSVPNAYDLLAYSRLPARPGWGGHSCLPLLPPADP